MSAKFSTVTTDNQIMFTNIDNIHHSMKTATYINLLRGGSRFEKGDFSRNLRLQ